MAEYFTERRETARFTLKLNCGNAVIECTVLEHWHPLIIDSV